MYLIAEPYPSQKSKEVGQFSARLELCSVFFKSQHSGPIYLNSTLDYSKKLIHKDALDANIPLVLWDYCAERQVFITNITAKNLFQLQGQNSQTATYGEQVKISNICQFGWYELAYARYGSEPFPQMTEILVSCLGTERNEGNEMTQWILNINRHVVLVRYLCKIHQDELSKETEISTRYAFDASIKLIHGDSFTVLDKDFEPNPQDAWDGEDHPILVLEVDAVDETGTPINTSSLDDTLINAQVVLPHGKSENLARVIQKLFDKYGNVIGSYIEYPILNTGI